MWSIKQFFIEISGFKDDVFIKMSFLWCTFNFILSVRYGFVLNYHDVISYSGFNSLLGYLLAAVPMLFLSHYICLHKKDCSGGMVLLILIPCVGINFIFTSVLLNDLKWPVGY